MSLYSNFRISQWLLIFKILLKYLESSFIHTSYKFKILTLIVQIYGLY
jgi:hypothetical protein